MKENAVLDIRNLKVSLPLGSDRPNAIADINLTVNANEILCIVGESGSGKSVLARSILGLLPEPKLKVTEGEVIFDGCNLLGASFHSMRSVRGSKISMIFQEPMTALNPLMRISAQMEEALKIHADFSRSERRALMSERLVSVGIEDHERIMDSYPHELSGGQRQRAMIAMALLLQPSILIADEPTTALDVTTQAKILHLIKEIQRVNDMAVLFITHDFGVVAEIADRVAVMEKGVLVELGNTRQVLENPQHPYTQGLIKAVPKMTFRKRGSVVETDPKVLDVRNLQKAFHLPGKDASGQAKIVHALRDVSVDIRRGETLGIVGESGSGKSTLARSIARLVEVDSGSIVLDGLELTQLSRHQLRRSRNKFQMVFQDPYSSLDPRWKTGHIIAEGLIERGTNRKDAFKRARDLLEVVGLSADSAERFPHEFSGGQRQRIAIARALAMQPELLIADEPVSALDVSVQAQVLKLLARIRSEMQLAMLFITHDLRIAAQVCDRICVMRSGEIVEQGTVEDVFTDPKHPYTIELLSAVPGLAKERQMGNEQMAKAVAQMVLPKTSVPDLKSMPGIGSDAFKRTMRQWAAGVTVVTVGTPPDCHGMTANSFTPLSRTPPLMLICIDRKNDTHSLLSLGSRFGINLLSDSQSQLSTRFSTKKAERNAFHELDWYKGEWNTTLFRDCAAVMEAEIVQLHDGGDHTIFVGQILSAEVNDKKSALLYSKGGYARLMHEALSETSAGSGT